MEQRCMYMRHDPNGGPGQSEGEKKKERDINLYISMTREGDPANQKVRRKKSVWCYALCCVLCCDACGSVLRPSTAFYVVSNGLLQHTN